MTILVNITHESSTSLNLHTSALKMEAACPSDTSVSVNKPEDYRVTALETLHLVPSRFWSSGLSRLYFEEFDVSKEDVTSVFM
jgi:hypothetical protein